MSLLKELMLGESLTKEMIHTQIDKAFIPLVEAELGTIKTIINNYDSRKGSDILSDSTVLSKIDNINKILSDRFGYKITVVNRDDGLISTIPVYPPNFSVLNGSATGFINSMSEYFTGKDKIYASPKDIKDYSKNVDAVYNNILNSYKALRDQLNKSNVMVDNKNAKINNLPNDYNVFIFMNFSYLLNAKGLNVSPSELMAGMLHEIGHNFTSFEKSIYSVYNTVLLMDSIQETINNKNTDPINVIKISYDKATGQKEASKNKDTLSVLSAVYNSLNGKNFGDDKLNQNSRISAEQQADQFVSRFAYGKELSTMLMKVGITERELTSVEVENNKGVVTTLVIIMAAGAAMASPLVAILPLWYLVFSFGFSVGEIRDYNNHNKIYDTGVRRLLRLKQDAIRQIRLMDKKTIESETIKRLEDTILIINMQVKILTDETNKGFLQKFFDRYQYEYKTKKVVNMVELVEELTENDLHYLNLKIKQMKA